jgi:penicillin G amidase
MLTTLKAALLRLALFFFALVPAAYAGWSSLDVADETVDIYRDDYGRPHIFAATNRGLFTAYGYALAEDRLWQLELNRRVARGRLAEILGPGTPQLSDTFIRTTGYTDAELDAQFAALDPAVQAMFQAYVDGINRYLAFAAQSPLSRFPYEFLALGIAPQPWTVRDTTAFAAFMSRRFGEVGGAELANQQLLNDLIAAKGLPAAVGIFNDVRWLVDPESPATIPDSGANGPRQHEPRSPHASQVRAIADLPENAEAKVRPLWEELAVPSRLGSYAFAVSPKKSAGGYAMLYGGPQLGFAAPETVHEVQLKSDEGFNVTGMAIAGIPFVIIGHNMHIAWTFTTGLANDNVDTYVEQFCSPTGYLFNGACRPFEIRTETINVRSSPPGTLPITTVPVTVNVLRSVHGPVVGASGPFAFTQKRAHWQTELASVEQLAGIDRAPNIGDFQRRIAGVTVGFNAVYADQRGNIGYWFAGLNAVRPEGFDPRLPLPGDGSAEWTGDYQPIQSSINPEQGWLANWNNRPTHDYPGNESSFGKIHRSNDLFANFAASTLSADDMRAVPKDIARVKGSVGREARFLMPYLRAALAAVPPSNSLAPSAQALLDAWDGSAFADAVTSTTLQPAELIFSTWLTRALNNTFADELGSRVGDAGSNMLLHALDQALGDGASVPPSRDYFNGVDPRRVLSQSFDEALTALAAAQGANPATWSAPRGNIVFAHTFLGTLATAPLSNRATYAQLVQLKSPRIEAENIFGLGQSGRITLGPGGAPVLDPHFLDQNALYRNFEYKPMPLYLNRELKE